MGSWEWDLVADEVTWSDQLYRLFGREPQRGTGSLDAFLSLLDPDERAAAERAVRSARDTGALFSFDHRVHLASGRVRILESRGQVLSDADGKPVRMVGTVEDVTAARRALHDLQVSERRLRSVNETAIDAIVIADDAGTIVEWNRAAADMFGHEAEAVVGRPLAGLVPRRVRAVFAQDFARFIQTGESDIVGRVVSIAGLRADGTEFPAELSVSTWSADGRRWFTGIIRDATEREEAAAALRRQERYVALLGEVARLANSSRTIGAAAPPSLRLVAEMTGWPVGQLLVHDHGEERLVPVGGATGAPEHAPLLRACRRPLQLDEGLAGQARRAGRPVWAADLGALPDPRAAVAASAGLPAGVAVPVVVGDDVCAVVEFFTDGAQEPGDDLISLLEQVGEHLGRVLERERAEEALSSSSRRFRTILEEGSDVAAILDLRGRIRYLSPASTRILGIDAMSDEREVVGRIHPDDLHHFVDTFDALRRTPGSKRRFEFRIRDGDQQWRSFETVATDLSADPEVGGIVMSCRDVTEQRRIEAHLEHQRLHDPLTGCPTRALFTEEVARALEREREHQRGLAVFAVDLDDFQAINGLHGHAVGDAVLVAVARRIEQVLRLDGGVGRPRVIVSRLGGDEFFALCEEVTIETVGMIGARLRDAIFEPLSVDGHEVTTAATIGVAVDRGGDVEAEDLLMQAETALRRARVDQVELGLYDQEVKAALARRDEAVLALRTALERDQLHLVYQPKVDASSGQVRGVEALVRWEHPTRGLVPPTEFIPLAEESGLIGALGEWVFSEACRQEVAWIEGLGDAAPPLMCVNVSAHQLVPQFVEFVEQLVRETRVPASSVAVEITESAVMGDVETAVVIVQRLVALGLQVAIDDFGTGHSSLAHLQRFPVHELKIDKSFIDGLGVDPETTAIVAAVVAMAHALDLDVVAEGVEHMAQLERLRVLGCEMAQGYLFSRPVHPREIAAGGPVLVPQVAPGGHVPAHAGRDVVLLVDDTADVRQLARVSLSTSGFDVLEASDGTEGLEVAGRMRPDCIVLDVSLPDMDGYEVCRALRLDPRTSGAAIVMLTSRAAATDKVDAYSAGADEYMVKPFGPRELVTRIRQTLDRRRTGR